MIKLLGAFVRAMTDDGRWVYGTLVKHDIMGSNVLAVKEVDKAVPNVVQADTISVSTELSLDPPPVIRLTDEQVWMQAFQGIAAGGVLP